MSANGRGVRIAVVLALLAAGALTPVLATGESVAPPPTQAQLSSLISAAEGSRAYAASMVGYASAHGVAVASSQSDLSQGDAQLADAKADARTGSNVAAGVQSVEIAMGYYSSAATSASVAIAGAGLGGTVDYSQVEQEIAEVNASVSAVASVAAGACASASIQAGPAALGQECSQLEASVSSSAASLDQASALAAQANGASGGAADYAQAVSLVSAAREEVNSTQAELNAVASYGYVARADSYVASFIAPLSAQANATIESEGSANSSFSAFRQSYLAFAEGQTASAGTIGSSASALASAIASVDFQSVHSNVSAADSVASSVGSNISALLALAGISLYPGVVSDADACQSADLAYSGDIATASSASAAFLQTGLPAFATYAGQVSSDSDSALTSGSAYVAACSKVITDLQSIVLTGVAAILSNLEGLGISGSVSGVDGSLSGEVTAMAAVQSKIGALSAEVATQAPNVLVAAGLMASASAETSSIEAYLNTTGRGTAAEAFASIQNLSDAASSFKSGVNSTLSLRVDAFVAGPPGAYDDQTLTGDSTASVSYVTTAAALLSGDLLSRTAEAASGQANISSALSLFSDLQLANGASALAQASLEFQAASSVRD